MSGSAPSGPPPSQARDAGSVTAEVAITLPAVVAVLVAVLVLTGAAITQVRCAEAARAGARSAALGEDAATVRLRAEAVLGASLGSAAPAVVTVRRDGAWAVVRVERPVVTAGWVGAGLVASAEARAWVEPGVVAGGSP